MRIGFLYLVCLTAAWAQPVILINGYQFPPCDSVTAEGTFGQLPSLLRSTGREVVFFNNCSVAAPAGATRPSLEDLGNALGERIAATGAVEVDVVVHSMGGLILRSYLSGKQKEAGVFRPPAVHKVRRAVFLGTPQFGPGLASTLLSFGGQDPQVRAIMPGSQFILDLATWNQGGDDLRGVDAVAVAGNIANNTDGLVPVPSASLSFAAARERTRLVPYCHTDVGALALVASACNRPPYIANVNNEDHLSWRIIRSFLAGTEEWKTLGTGMTDGSAGGIVVSVRDKDDQPVAGVSAVTADAVPLQKVTDHFYAEQIAPGAKPLAITTPGGAVSGSQAVTGGAYSVAVVKPGPWAVAALPAAGRVPTRTVAPGMFVSIYGATLASSSAAASALPLPVTLAGTQVMADGAALGLQFAGPTQINAIVPEDASGLLTVSVESGDGKSRIRLMVEPAVPAIFTQLGTGSGPASAIDALNGAVITAQTRAGVGDVISLYLTGLGATELRDGLAWAKLTPKVFVGGQQAQVTYAGRAPGYAGLDQINFVVPQGVAAGEGTELRVESNGRVSNLTALPTR